MGRVGAMTLTKIKANIKIGDLLADTLANLNTKVSDATLDDSGDSRTPAAHEGTHASGGSDDIDSALAAAAIPAHDLAGTKHNADTLADLNNKVSDATLVDSPPAPTKEILAVVHFASIMASPGGLISGAAEAAAMMMLVPQDFNSLTSIEVEFRPQATGASMHLNINTYYGAYHGEAYNTHNESAVARDIGATVADQTLAHDISDLVDVAALAAGDLLVVSAVFNVTAIETNLYVQAIRFKYT